MVAALNILHVASFSGNFGDVASHRGLYNLLDQLLIKYVVTELEIRKSYRNYSGEDGFCFDEVFADYANSFDLLIIGGGGFLDYHIENSPTGTSLGFTREALNKLNVKTLITSVGCVTNKEYPKVNAILFESFIKELVDKDNVSVFLRNDGSLSHLTRNFNVGAADGIFEVLDSGFFYKPNKVFKKEFSDYFALNVASDQLAMSTTRDPVELEVLISECIATILRETELEIMLFAHVPSDYNYISKILDRYPSFHHRKRFLVAPMFPGVDGCDDVFNLYRSSKGIIASRLHANICNLISSVPVIGLPILPRVESLYKSLSHREALLADPLKVVDQLSGIENPYLQIDKRKLDTLFVYKNALASFID